MAVSDKTEPEQFCSGSVFLCDSGTWFQRVDDAITAWAKRSGRD